MSVVAEHNVVSLFSGCGGLDSGFHAAGFNIINAYDINPLAVETYNKNISNSSQVLDLSYNIPKLKNVDLLLAGSPCQGFSTVGKRDFLDPRNSLLTRTGEIALKLKPKVILAENVPGALQGNHKTYWENLEESLKTNGYSVKTINVNAYDLGVAQRRKRIFLLAWKNKKSFEFNLPLVTTKSLANVINNIPESSSNHNPLHLLEDSDDYKIALRIKSGMKLSNVRTGSNSLHTWDIPEVFGRVSEFERKILDTLIKLRRQIRTRTFGDADPVEIEKIKSIFGSKAAQAISSLLSKGFVEAHENSIDIKHAFNGKYKRLKWDQPSYTVDTYFGNPRYFLHPDENRGFTVREAARIQGFPDSFIFPENNKKSFEMIGNAVSPIVAQHFAEIIRDRLLA